VKLANGHRLGDGRRQRVRKLANGKTTWVLRPSASILCTQ
jgi:hypothetical protein